MEEEKGREQSAPCVQLPSTRLNQTESQPSSERVADSNSFSRPCNCCISAHVNHLKEYLHPAHLYKEAGVQTDHDDQEQMVTLTWPNFKSLVELYAKDERKRAKLLGSEFPNNDLLEVPTKQEPMNILGPEPAFQLTGSEFRTVVEGLASEEQKLTSFEQLLDLEKDSVTGNDLPLMQRAENMLYRYQCLPDSSIEKLVSALYSIGLSLPAETISLSKKK